ncbi:alanyl-tRNA editing protein [Ferrovibrio sp.]|uniref:alanyl-tRNA editing protein n=1 Tax=Ferrovibrio sp. TaxID=1917215 RepID=UPI0035B4E908
MLRKVFWEDPYLAYLETEVATVDGSNVTLTATIIYAFSGGQESDHGTIGGHEVLDARKAGADIIYTLPTGHGLAPGTRVATTIDWERRYRLMRLHFAAEIVLEIVYRDLGPIEKIGAHIAADKARIDFARATPVTPELAALTARADAVIAADLPITSAFSDIGAGRRYWQVAGFDPVPCGGTHLKRTGEVGPLTLKRRNIGKGKERIEIFLQEPVPA